MRALSGLIRRQQRELARATRDYAAQAAVIPAEESPFLRFANPVPQIYTHESILGEVPETKVQSLLSPVCYRLWTPAGWVIK